MTIYAVAIRRGEAKWIDSQWVSKEAAEERAHFIVASYNSTNVSSLSIAASVLKFKLEDARPADPGGAS